MRIFFFLFLIWLSNSTSAREGMWMPQLLKELNENEMKSMGMEISADDIYSINHSSLKDAVLQFGGGCTGEVISSKGLLITNHHCGFSQIQSLSTIEKNYLKEGYWSSGFEDELPCPGLTVTFIKEIKDVSDAVLAGIPDSLSEDARSRMIKLKTDSIEKTVDSLFKGIIRPFYQGNKYYLFITETFNDIRFVGAPPQAIGKFGGETDNWMWPRHTGDFSLFRIYANKDNLPAAYSKQNIPYVPKYSFPLNIKGVKENDFIFMFGFPGRTNEYLLSPALDVIANQTNPNRIAIRDIRLNAWREAMNRNDTIRLQYASKFSTLENAYKKWEGEQEGFGRFDLLTKKRIQERKFIASLSHFPSIAGDTSLITRFSDLNAKARPLNQAIDYYTEAFNGIELLNASVRFKTFISLCQDKAKDDKSIDEEVKKIKNDFRLFYKNYNLFADRKICASLLAMTYSNLDKKYLPEKISNEGSRSKDFVKYTDWLYAKSLAGDSTRLMKFFSSFKRRDVKRILKDPSYILVNEISASRSKIQTELDSLNKSMARLQRIYMKDLMVVSDTSVKLYPDANSTLRVSYGKVENTSPNDGMEYRYFTTTEGILEKSRKGNRDYEIPERLKTLLAGKEFGRYGSNGILPVAFLSSSHSTGGNSGSPILNSKGELVGVNYDRIWEGVLSDYYYDKNYFRNVSLDIRYALFIIEKYGNATRLLDEMKIVQ